MPAPAAARSLLALQRGAGNRAAGLAVQRALSHPVPSSAAEVRAAVGKATPVSTRRHAHTEAISGAADVGVESDTGSFTHENDSDLLDPQVLGWRGNRIGTFKPAGKIKGDKRKANFTSLVKMHLVNSFLHKDANAWEQNWVWGHADLNKAHNKDIEEPAKNLHPGTGGVVPGSMHPVLALGYRSDQAGRSTTGGATAQDMAEEIAFRVDQQAMVGMAPTSAAEVEAEATIGGLSVPDFFARWSAAVAATTASRITADARAYAEDGATLERHDEALPAVTDPDPVEFRAQVLVDADRLLGYGALQWADGTGGGAPPAKRARRSDR